MLAVEILPSSGKDKPVEVYKLTHPVVPCQMQQMWKKITKQTAPLDISLGTNAGVFRPLARAVDLFETLTPLSTEKSKRKFEKQSLKENLAR